jgi:hypothetical protein
MLLKAKKIARPLIALALAVLFIPAHALAYSQISIGEFGDRGLDVFLEASSEGVPVEMLVGIWLYEGRDIANPDPQTLETIASILATRAGSTEYLQLGAYVASAKVREEIRGRWTACATFAMC